ncbi:MAG: CHAT domain-containing protein [Synechococcaceae cyanobacterium]|nr:CHAT domain-containing protein [Synechococcaceae cyanobacterium]
MLRAALRIPSRWGAALLLPLALVASAPPAAAQPAPAPAPRGPVVAGAFRFDPRRYTPAVLRLSVTTPAGGQGKTLVDLTLIPPYGPPAGRRVEVDTAVLGGELRRLYVQVARQEPMAPEDPSSPARRLYRVLLAPVQDELDRHGVTTLLISADAGLQAVPFAALHDGSRFVGERYALAVTPSLRLTPLRVPSAGGGSRQLAAGASHFEGLAPLPLVPQELERVERGRQGQRFLDASFTPDVLLELASDPQVGRVHVATHAEFLPGGPDQARLYTGTGPIGLADFAALRNRRRGAPPLDLFTLSACRTALGDSDSELGFAGLALQAGARSAIGTLWYVDDVATSAFFVQFYRYLEQGLPKAEALQATRMAMASGLLRLEGDRVVGPDGSTLLAGLGIAERRRIAGGLQHPYYWGGITLLGVPW